MNIDLFTAIIFINVAALLYTIGVLSEKFQGILKWWHTIIFWLGLICDAIGTAAMGNLTGGIFELNLHSITGLSALFLMFLHTIWATWILATNNQTMKITFHKFSIIVWIIWLIPFITGILINIF